MDKLLQLLLLTKIIMTLLSDYFIIKPSQFPLIRVPLVNRARLEMSGTVVYLTG
jgi:hypothetical protein